MSEQSIAVIAADGVPAEIVEILEQQRLEPAAFASAECLIAAAGEWSPAAIVVCFDREPASASAASAGTPEAATLQAIVEPLTRRFAGAPVLVVCSRIDRRAVRAALAAGASGVVLHDELGSALAPSLHAVRAGQLCLPRRDWQEVEPSVLSSREKQVLGLVVMGYMNSQIAEQLFLAESTVKSHLSSAFSKLGVRSRHEAVARILDPQAGLGVGILTLGGEPLQAAGAGAR